MLYPRHTVYTPYIVRNTESCIGSSYMGPLVPSCVLPNYVSLLKEMADLRKMRTNHSPVRKRFARLAPPAAPTGKDQMVVANRHVKRKRHLAKMVRWRLANLRVELAW